MDRNRRKFLKILLIGGGTLLVGKVFGSTLLKFLDKSSTTNKLTVAQPVPKTFYDNLGREILQIDDAA